MRPGLVQKMGFDGLVHRMRVGFETETGGVDAGSLKERDMLLWDAPGISHKRRAEGGGQTL
jgi:hypothetical protein